MNESALQPNLVFSDLDGTLFRGNATRLFLDQAYQRGYLSRSDVTQALMIATASRPLPINLRLRLGWRTFARIMANKSYVIYEELAEKCADFIAANLFQNVYTRLQAHQATGAKVILVSASPVEIVSRVASKLNFDGAEASELTLTRDHTRLNGGIASPLCYGSEKIRRAQQACDRLNRQIASPATYTLMKSAYYADDMSDLYLLARVGCPVAVNPIEPLKQQALKRNWEILIANQ